MSIPHLGRVAVRNAGCVFDTTLSLSPLHALVGPPGSGKSALLRGIQSALGWPMGEVESSACAGQTVELSLAGSTIVCSPDFTTPGSVSFSSAGLPVVGPKRAGVSIGGPRAASSNSAPVETAASSELHTLSNWIAPAALLQLDAKAMREPSAPLSLDDELAFSAPGGTGLASLLEALRDRGGGTFEAIFHEWIELFPAMSRAHVERRTHGTDGARVSLRNAGRPFGDELTDAMLHTLGFLVLERCDRPSAFLVEHPENGLPPSRVADVMTVLRRISEHTQVVLTTSSPRVLDELQGREISLVTRAHPAVGTKAVLLTDAFGYADRQGAGGHGQLWLARYDGKTERELLDGPNDHVTQPDSRSG